MDLATQRQKAETFRKLHDRSRILVLPNAWDVTSAKIFEAAGFRAVATTSSGVANSLGYPDGESVSRDEMLDVIRRIARGLTVPLSADIEAGYASGLDGLTATIRAVIDAGAVGINLEDSIKGGANELFPLETAVARIKAVRETAAAAGVPIVINARTDVFLHAIGDKSARLDHTVSRANAYHAAGADCVFVPGPTNAELIGSLTSAIKGPINVMVLPGLPSAPELQKLGVARVSTGGGPARAALTALRRLAKELLESGTYSAFVAPDLISHMVINLFVSNKPFFFFSSSGRRAPRPQRCGYRGNASVASRSRWELATISVSENRRQRPCSIGTLISSASMTADNSAASPRRRNSTGP